MSVKTNRVNSIPIASLKVVYYYAKMLGMVYFSITEQKRLRSTVKARMFSISYRLSCLVAYTFFLPEIFKNIVKIPQIHIRAMGLIELISIVIYTLVYLLFQTMCHKQFVSVVNRAIDIFDRTSLITGDAQIFGREFYFMFVGRTVTNALTILMDSSKLLDAARELNIPFMLQCFLGYCLWFGTLMMVDLLCLGYITASGLYRNIGNHMVSFAKSIEMSEGVPMTKFRRMQMLCEFSDELDKCSDLYSQIFGLTREFHKLFQFNILLTFYFDLVMIIGNIHYNFLHYRNTGQIMWSFMALGIVRTVDLFFLVLVIDLTVRRSKAPNCLNWDSFCSDTDDRWDRAVDHFLNQMKLEDLRIDVYGFFQLNNEFCLRIFSAVVAYLTILIQFSMLGYFNEANKRPQLN